MNQKNIKWKERLIVLAIAYGIFLLEFAITRIGNLPSDYLIGWSTTNMLIPLMIMSLLMLIPNLKLISLSFPLGHVLGIIIGSIFGTKVPDGGGILSPNHWVFYVWTLVAIILVAVIFEILLRIKAHKKAKEEN